jgi:hypothetical protein
VLRQTSVDIQVDDSFGAELDAHAPGIAAQVAAYQSALASQRQDILTAITDHRWELLPISAVDPRQKLRGLVEARKESAAALLKAGDAVQRPKLVSELQELKARVGMISCSSV